MDKWAHAQESVGWDYWSYPELQLLHRWSLGMDEWFHPILYNGCDYLYILGLNSTHVTERDPVGNVRHMNIYQDHDPQNCFWQIINVTFLGKRSEICPNFNTFQATVYICFLEYIYLEFDYSLTEG